MIELVGGKYRMYRADRHNINVERWAKKKEIERGGKTVGGGEGWILVGHYSEVDDAFDGLGRDAFRQAVATREELVEIRNFKRNLIKFKNEIVAEIRKHAETFGKMLRSQHARCKDNAEEE